MTTTTNDSAIHASKVYERAMRALDLGDRQQALDLMRVVLLYNPDREDVKKHIEELSSD